MGDIIKFADHVPADMRYVVPTSFLMSTDCGLQAPGRPRARSPQARRQIPPLRRVERRYLIGSQTMRGYLTTYIHYETRRIEHAWTYDH